MSDGSSACENAANAAVAAASQYRRPSIGSSREHVDVRAKRLLRRPSSRRIGQFHFDIVEVQPDWIILIVRELNDRCEMISPADQSQMRQRMSIARNHISPHVGLLTTRNNPKYYRPHSGAARVGAAAVMTVGRSPDARESGFVIFSGTTFWEMIDAGHSSQTDRSR
jgi:hypothetical protein